MNFDFGMVDVYSFHIHVYEDVWTLMKLVLLLLLPQMYIFYFVELQDVSDDDCNDNDVVDLNNIFDYYNQLNIHHHLYLL